MGKRGPKPGARYGVVQPLIIDPGTGAAVLITKATRTRPAYRLLLDLEDFDRVNAHTWTPITGKSRARIGKGQNNVKDHLYFMTAIPQADGKPKSVSLQRFIMRPPAGKLVGFKDHDYTDLRKDQLQIVSQTQVNQRMRKTTKRTVSRFKGVSRKANSHTAVGTFIAQVCVNGTVRRIEEITASNPDAEIICARAYDCFVLANRSNPNPNFPASSYSREQIEAYKTVCPIPANVCAVVPSPPVGKALEHRRTKARSKPAPRTVTTTAPATPAPSPRSTGHRESGIQRTLARITKPGNVSTVKWLRTAFRSGRPVPVSIAIQ